MLSLTRLPKAGICLIAAVFTQQSFSSSLSNASTTSASNSSANCAFVSSSSISSQLASPLTCSVNLTSEWTGGYQVDVKIGNSATTPSSNWTVVLDVPAGDSLVSAWNAVQLAQN